MRIFCVVDPLKLWPFLRSRHFYLDLWDISGSSQFLSLAVWSGLAGVWSGASVNVMRLSPHLIPGIKFTWNIDAQIRPSSTRPSQGKMRVARKNGDQCEGRSLWPFSPQNLRWKRDSNWRHEWNCLQICWTFMIIGLLYIS